MKVKAKVNKVKTYSYSLLKGMRNSSTNQTNSVLLLFFGRIGDAVMFLDVLDAYKELYVTEQDKRIVFACRKEVWALLQAVNATDNLEFFEIHRENLYKSFEYFKGRVKKANEIKPEVVLHIRENHVIENVFVHAIRSKEKIIYRVYPINHSTFWSNYFSSHTYTKDLCGKEDIDYLTSQADLIRRLGKSNYKSIIPLLPKVECSGLPEAHTYVCVCPGASVDNKCWPAERYAHVVDYIIERFNTDVVFSGGKEDAEGVSKIISLIGNRNRIIDLTGKTSIREWISVIQHAVLVLTNESGSVHLAASSNVPSVCVGEQKFSDKWLPYRPEILRANDIIPIVVRGKRLSCTFCAKNNFEWSSECKECYRENGLVKCVYEVKEEEVERAIDHILR